MNTRFQFNRYGLARKGASKVTQTLPKCMEVLHPGSVPKFSTLPAAMFFFHDSTGVVDHFRSMLPRKHANEETVGWYAVKLVDEAPLDTLDALAGFYLQAIKQIYPNGCHVFLGGYSFGVSIAAMVAHKMTSTNLNGDHDHMFNLCGFIAVEDGVSLRDRWTDRTRDRLLHLLVSPSDAVAKKTLEARMDAATSRLETERCVVEIPISSRSDLLTRMLTVMKSNTSNIARSLGAMVKALRSTTFTSSSNISDLVFSCDILLVRSTDEFRRVFNIQSGQHFDDADECKREDASMVEIERDYGLSRLSHGAVGVEMLHCSHENMFNPQNGRKIGKFISSFITSHHPYQEKEVASSTNAICNPLHTNCKAYSISMSTATPHAKDISTPDRDRGVSLLAQGS
eukprot:m.68288 g.68288  ORF g.68288 m.68288 type:complete len:398 (-) comp8242_c0_seq1:1041-2234(-)